MSYEFIIGTLIGIAGLALTWICSKEQIKSYFKPNMQDLFNQLASANISSTKQKILLKKISHKMAFWGMGKVSSEYITDFSLINCSKSAIFLDICVQNNIEPTPDLCKALLGYNSPSLRQEYHHAINGEQHQMNEAQDNEDLNKAHHSIKCPNVVYISGLLEEKFPHATGELLAVLKKHNVTVRVLKNTKDIWCRDYMPVQNSQGELIQFNYDPSYLKGKQEWEESKSDVHEVCKANGINPIFSDIKIDGGNVLICGEKAILTSRIFDENPEYDRKVLVAEIERLLKARVYIIPAYSISEDLTGHADGMVRFVDENTILGNERTNDYQYMIKGLEEVCNEAKLIFIDVPYFTPKADKQHELNAIGIYVNYLEVDNLIVLPKFGVEGNRDQETVELFKKIFPDRIIETVDYNDVAVEGGLLNCTTWTIVE